jgi:hypothetical protein
MNHRIAFGPGRSALGRRSVGMAGLLVLALSLGCGGRASSPNSRIGAGQQSVASGCPDVEPGDGTSCTLDGGVCSYGSSARPDCRDLLSCESGTWQSDRAGCPTLPSGYCPQQQPTPSACTAIADPSMRGDCAYEGGVLCACPCVAAPGTSTCEPSSWVCYGPPTAPGCPSSVPNRGTACSVQGANCVYGNPCDVDGIVLYCRAGVWDLGDAQCPG